MIITISDDAGNVLQTYNDAGTSIYRKTPDHVCEGIVHVDERHIACVVKKESCGMFDQINPWLKDQSGRKVKVLFFLE
jgi:hypothetical protein